MGGEIKTSLHRARRDSTSYQIAPWGARSKQITGADGRAETLTKLPRGGRDQNKCPCRIAASRHLPNCPVGGEIKTENGLERLTLNTYQIAPWGARSKPPFGAYSTLRNLTKLPRGGRDQNHGPSSLLAVVCLPNCPVGGEIKTSACTIPPPAGAYQIAPWGARSKHTAVICARHRLLTKLPRGGRDQNHNRAMSDLSNFLPNCPVGGEIKTQKGGLGVDLDLTKLPRGGRDQNGRSWTGAKQVSLPNCPVGGEIKTSDAKSLAVFAPYQIAPWGARSKHDKRGGHHRCFLTKLPRGGRDQNDRDGSDRVGECLPNCPVGGEIKTAGTRSSSFAATYQIAPWGARSKRRRC